MALEVVPAAAGRLHSSPLGVALSGQLSPLRQDGPNLAEEPAAQGFPRILAGEGASAARLAYRLPGGSHPPPRYYFPS